MSDPRLVDALSGLVRDALAGIARRPVVIGLCGAQGSGKSTLVGATARALAGEGLRVATLSLDDLYLTRAQRQTLAREVHPLLALRGPPGTHDVALGLATLDAMARGEPAPLPRFDKGADERMPREHWPLAAAGSEVLLLEGWCLGAQPQAHADLTRPINTLEREEDPDSRWRQYVNAALAGDYRHLYARIDRLAFLAAPDWPTVCRWRAEAEVKLRATDGATRAMAPGELARFMQAYERITLDLLADLPPRADLVIRLDGRRTPIDPGPPGRVRS